MNADGLKRRFERAPPAPAEARAEVRPCRHAMPVYGAGDDLPRRPTRCPACRGLQAAIVVSGDGGFALLRHDRGGGGWQVDKIYRGLDYNRL